ncbi:hypothetical protein M9Y10_045359 [Tritrichomonas musculus]|uniref:Uncharacterized protein n=1 Tax=Tritrichomonas musculus TaxID=1915356 RepID=A0ABR2JVS1_9EUKA
MWRNDCETMSFENTSDFRQLLRKLHFQIQEICYFYQNSDFQIDYFLTFSKQINDTISQILHFTQFSERRKPIQDFHQFFIQFKDTFQSHYNEFFNNIKDSLNEVLKNGLENQEIIQFDNFDLKSSTSWEQICEPLKGLRFTSNLDFQKKIRNIYSKGEAIALIYDLFTSLEQFYNDFPKEMTNEEKEKFKLNRQVSQLEEQITLLKKENQTLINQNKGWQTKYSILHKMHKSMEESMEKVKEELKEANHLKDYADVQIGQIKNFFSKYRKQNEDDDEFDPDAFAKFIKDNQDEFEDIMFELDL